MTTIFDKKAVNRIKESFGKMADNYDKFASFQRKTAGMMARDIFPEKIISGYSANILDIGCGTGFATEIMLKKTINSTVTAFDLAFPMIKMLKGKIKSQRVNTVIGNACSLPFKKCCFDLLISNLAYQWVNEPELAFTEALRVLKPGGTFHLSILCSSTLRELRESAKEISATQIRGQLPPFIMFPSHDELLLQMSSAGFSNLSLQYSTEIRFYESLWSLLRAIKYIGAGNPFSDGDKSLARGTVLKRLALDYQNRYPSKTSEIQIKGSGKTALQCNSTQSNGVYATYEVAIIRAAKK